ncbi:MAG: class I SAM-dependent methyltransferase [Lachnospiraceae bacterium]
MGYIKRKIRPFFYKTLKIYFDDIHEEVNKTHEEVNKIYEELNGLNKAVADLVNSNFATEDDFKALYRVLLKRELETGGFREGVLLRELFYGIVSSEEYKKINQDIPWIKDLMNVKWETRDYIRKNLDMKDTITCTLCGYENSSTDFEEKVTECIFGGGTLVRHVCPKCGVIFGDEKFTKMTQKEIDNDYRLHYQGFSEGDSTEKELKAFYALKPNKEKKYLNYGCGVWSNSIEILRKEGYDVYGYEPYAENTTNPFIISDVYGQELKFDGIFSNDLLEHCIDPIKDLIQMKQLLKDEYSCMSHSTSCYAYKYEYTRFHTHFFVGDSVEVLAGKAGLKIKNFIDELEEKDFMCCVFEQN